MLGSMAERVSISRENMVWGGYNEKWRVVVGNPDAGVQACRIARVQVELCYCWEQQPFLVDVETLCWTITHDKLASIPSQL